MALTLLTGRANSGKTGVAYGCLADALAGGRAPVLLLPTRPDVSRATDELSRRHPFGLHVAQLDDWIGELWSLYGDGRVPVEDEQRLAILQDMAAAADLRRLRPSAATPGFARLLARVARLASEEEPEALDRVRARSGLDRDVVRLLAAYRDALSSRGLVEPAAAARLLSLDPPGLAGPVVVHRFSDLSSSQEALLVALSEPGDVLITLPWESGFPATEALDGLVARLESSGEHRHLAAHAVDGELSRLEGRLFLGGPTAPPEGAVRFCTAAGAEAEATLIAREAAAAAELYGPDRVAVVFRDAAPHVEHVRLALAGEGIPADVDVLVPFTGTPFGRALGHLVSAFGVGDPAPELAAFLRGPFSGAGTDEGDALDARWRGSPGLARQEVVRQATRIGSSTRRVLDAAKRACRTGASPEEWQNLADALLAAEHRPGTMPDHGDAVLDAAAHRTLSDVVSRLSALGGDRVDVGDVWAALAAAKVQAGPSERPGHVQITEAHRVRARRFDAVVVGGLTADGFSSEGRVAPAAEIAARLFGRDRPTEQSAERLLFYQVCTRARRLLVLARQTADSDGGPRRASVFWEEALDLYREPSPERGVEADDGAIAATVRLSDLEGAAPALTPGRAAARARASASGGALSRSRGGRLTDPETLAELAARDVFSATELEAYARCPYRWFYERAVHPEALDAGLDALSRGDLAHRALASLYGEALPRLGITRVTPEGLADALHAAEAAFDAEASSPRTPAPTTLLEEDAIARLRERVRSLVAEDSTFLPGFEPLHVELRFGLSSQDDHPAVDMGGFDLRGIIDRVDRGPAGLAVIDYKTGAAPKLADIASDRRIQVPLYAAAAERLLGEPVVAGLYRSLRDGGARGFYRSDAVTGPGLTSTDAVPCADDARALVESAVEIAREAVRGIRDGSIPAAPVSPRACEYCSARSFCGGGE